MSISTVLESLCDSIFSSNKNIQSVAVINNKGRTMEKISKPRFAKQFSDYFNELFCMHHILQISMGKDFDEKYGPVNYCIFQRTNLAMLSFPVDDIVILVTTNKKVGPITLARKIINIIEDHRKQ